MAEEKRAKAPAKIPLIVEKDRGELALPELRAAKFLIPEEYLFMQLTQLLRTKLQLEETQTMFVHFRSAKLYSGMHEMADIYRENVDEDGFLYCRYTSENIFGGET